MGYDNDNRMEEKVYFNPGDVVLLKQEIPNKPLMVVKEVNKAVVREPEHGGRRGVLFGITCFWFTKDGLYQTEKFNTKDLKHRE